MTTPRSPYELLGVGPTATAAEIQQAFKDALRARTHPPQHLRHAVEQLRVPRTRLRHDLLEPEAPDLDDRLAALLEDTGDPGAIDDSSVPLPTWESLVRPELGGPAVLDGPLEPPERSFPLLDGDGGEPRLAVPHFVFPVLP